MCFLNLPKVSVEYQTIKDYYQSIINNSGYCYKSMTNIYKSRCKSNIVINQCLIVLNNVSRGEQRFLIQIDISLA